MKKAIGVILLVAVAVLGVGAVIAFATGEADHAAAPAADTVFLGEVDLAEQMEIWRNQYRRMTPGDAPLVQDVGTWPAAWEEFSSRWASAPAERNLATWLVPVVAERTGALTVLRDADGNALWSGTTDFSKEESANVTLTGSLVSEEDWALWEAAREEIDRRLGATRFSETGGGMRGTNGPYTNGLRFTNIWMETNGDYRLDLAWEEDGEVEVFSRAMHTETWTNIVVYTNDENEVVTNEFTHWRQLDTFHGIPDDWVLLGTTIITNGSGSFTDTNHVPDYDRVKFYVAAALADFDNDGLSDGQEWTGGTNPANGDSDNDGLSDYDERNVYHTDPNKADTDEDGIDDGNEVLRGLDPRDKDSDHDGLNDGAEDVWQTEALNPDSDRDGLPDGWEVDNGLVPTNANGANGADGDPDGDGFPNSLEFLLGGGAMNPAWSGEQLAYRLCHLQNGDNQPGLRVDIEDALNCGGSNDTHQNVAASLNVPALMDCGYYINLAVEGKVEDQNSGYDKVSFEAAADTEFFEGNNNLNRCTMATKCATNQVLIMANSQVRLRYDTVGHMYHTGAYAKVVDATVAAPCGVEVEGPGFMIVGDTAQMTVTEAVAGTWSWSVSGDAATITSGGLLTAATSGVSVVTATAPNGCSVSKEVVVFCIDSVQVREARNPCNRVPNPKQDHPNRLFVATDGFGEVVIEVEPVVQPAAYKQHVMCAVGGSFTDESALLDTDGIAVLAFTPWEDVEPNFIGIGLDDNGNGVLDSVELRAVATNLELVSFTDAHYGEKRSLLSFGAHNAVGQDLSATLLIRFLNEGQPPLSFDATLNALINCFSQANLTHNAGANFDILGNGMVEVNVWDESSVASVRIAESDEMASCINQLLTNNIAEAIGYLESHPAENTYAAFWTTNDVPVNFDKGLSDGNHELDLHLAFGNAVFPEVRIWVAVKRRFLGGYAIGQLTVEGRLEDLYDFNYERAEPNNDAAVLQIGWDDEIDGRDAGVIFFDKVNFRRTFSSWNSFDFNF